jgi:hypothetical protein
MRHANAALAALAALLAAPVAAAGAQQLIVNGGFELGFSGWTRAEFPGSEGTTFVGVGTSSPINGFPVPGARSGSSYAVTDASGPGGHVLSQTFVIAGPVASATLRFSLSPANRASANVIGPDLNPFAPGPRQYATVDLFAGAVSGLATAGALQNFFLGGTVGSGAVPYTDYVFDVTSLLAASGTYTIRFAEVDNVATFNLAVDDVSLVVVSSVPEPTTTLLLATGLAAVLIGVRRRGRSSA